MSKLGTHLRQCPSCGHRFHVKLVNEELLSNKEIVEPVSRDDAVSTRAGSLEGIPRSAGYSPPAVHEKGKLTIDIKEFEDSFKCERCGHEWSERRVKESEETR